MKFQAAIIGLLGLSASSVHATINVTTATAAAMVDFLVAADTSLTIVGTPTLTGNSSCAGIFTGGRLAVPNGVLPGPDIDFPDEGIVISTGLPKALAFQTSYRKSHDLGSAGDADLDALLTTSTTHEACALEFQFECSVDPCEISFDYVFGSEEYLEFVASPYNDVFAWFLNGKNIAIVPGTDDFVSVDTINDVVNSQYYVNNDPWQPPVPFPKLEADGFTIPLQATGLASSKSVNTMKLVIADNADTALDSWTLMAKKSFKGPIPRSAGAGGDPHFKRWGQERRDTFHGECDLVLLHSDGFQNGAGLDIHIRTTIADSLYSYIESAAVKIGGYVLEVSNGSFRLEGTDYQDESLPMSFGDDSEYTFELNNLEHDAGGNVKRRLYRLSLGSTSIDFKYYKNLMTFSLNGHDDLEDVVGMLGSYPSGEMIGRDGNKIDNFLEFGFEWQVGRDDPTIFSEAREPQLPFEQCRMPSKVFQTNRRRLRGENAQLFEKAQNACSTVKGSDFDLCIHDVMATGDINLAFEW